MQHFEPALHYLHGEKLSSQDGKWTEKVRDMRPISVLQEFGKIASKILATRVGDRILANPSALNSAQRAFLKDGCIQQCINTALNVFEDFKDKKEKGKQLFVVSYDQEKAYDSVQAYTIKASLERFNMQRITLSDRRFNLEVFSKSMKRFKTACCLV